MPIVSDHAGTNKRIFFSSRPLGLVLLLILSLGLPIRAEEVVLSGKVERVLLQGTPLNLRIIQLPLDPDFYAANFDLEEKFREPKVGDRIISELTEPIRLDGEIGLPAGTRFYGEVVRINSPKHFGQDGSLELSFGSMRLPDGQLLKIEPVNHQNQLAPRSNFQNLAFGTTRTTLYGLGGAATGALAAVYFAGIAGAALAPAYVIGSGAGLGLVVGVVSSIVKKGQPGRLQPGDELQVHLAEDLSLPILKASPNPPSNGRNFSLKGLLIEVEKLQVYQDDFDKPVLLITLKATNQTPYVFKTNNLVLRGPYGKEFLPGGMALDYQSLKLGGPSLFGKTLSPGEQIEGSLAFDLDFPGLDHGLGWKDSHGQRLVYFQEIGSPERYRVAQSRKSLIKKQLFGEGSDPWR